HRLLNVIFIQPLAEKSYDGAGSCAKLFQCSNVVSGGESPRITLALLGATQPTAAISQRLSERKYCRLLLRLGKSCPVRPPISPWLGRFSARIRGMGVAMPAGDRRFARG